MPYIEVLKFSVQDVIATSIIDDEDLPPEVPSSDLQCI